MSGASGASGASAAEIECVGLENVILLLNCKMTRSMLDIVRLRTILFNTLVNPTSRGLS